MQHLRALEQRSLFLIREAFHHLGASRTAALWSMGKDSTTLLWLIRKAFLGEVPFPVIHIDTGVKFAPMYEFRDQLAKDWNLDLRIAKNDAALTQGMNFNKGRQACCQALKTDAFRAVVDEMSLKGVYLAIRRDEHGVRAKERYVSPRDGDFHWDYKQQPGELWDEFTALQSEDAGHFRIHPLLDWTETDIWEYIALEKIPVIDLYFAQEGKRYRSLGCMPCTAPVLSSATNVEAIIAELKAHGGSERDGRAQDKEHADAMQKLRSLGYM